MCLTVPALELKGMSLPDTVIFHDQRKQNHSLGFRLSLVTRTALLLRTEMSILRDDKMRPLFQVAIVTKLAVTQSTAPKLADHEITHDDPKPFKCSLCDKEYAARNGLTQHRIKVHNVGGVSD